MCATSIVVNTYILNMYLQKNLKVTIKTAADDIFIYLLFFLENKSRHFMWIICQADDSHEISRLIFYEKIKINCRLLQIFKTLNMLLFEAFLLFLHKKKKKKIIKKFRYSTKLSQGYDPSEYSQPTIVSFLKDIRTILIWRTHLSRTR